MGIPIHDPTATAPAGSREVKNTTCYMCACRCGIRVHLQDGKLRYIDGNPDHPLNQGVICAKGSSGIMKQYSPARLTQPLRRKQGAERGAAEFEAISWDEAFTLLEERLGKIRATDPPRCKPTPHLQSTKSGKPPATCARAAAAFACIFAMGRFATSTAIPIIR